MPRRKVIPEPEPEKRRSDFGSYKITPKDWKGLPLVAQQRYCRYDTLGEWWAPKYEPAIVEPRPEKQKQAGPGPGRGGKRTGLPWPMDYQKRLAAVTRIVDRHWIPMGLAMSMQPFQGTPRWVTLTEQGLHLLGLSLGETPFPDNLKFYEHSDERRCHTHCINQVRIYLARGGAGLPKSSWTSERALEARFSLLPAEQALPHLPDGMITIEEEGSWDIRDIDDQILTSVPLLPGNRIAIEVELNRKSYPRLREEIFPSLLRSYDYVWYFCEPEARRAVYEARQRHLSTDKERARLRIMLLDEHLPHLRSQGKTPSA